MIYKTLIATVLVLTLGLLTACSGTKIAGDSLTYDDIRGSGLANDCPALTGTNMDAIPLEGSQPYQIRSLCLQPQTFLVETFPSVNGQLKKQAGRFVEGKLLTRSSFTLDQVSGQLQKASNGALTFVEQGGFDFQPVTVQIPNGDRVPLLFTVKGLVAKTAEAIDTIRPSTRFSGSFDVPPYRTSSFIDPKGRGLAVGYDAAVGIPIQADREAFSRQNNKSFKVGTGNIVLQVDRVNQSTGEISGSFESQQPSDTDFGSKPAMTVKILGQFYSRITPEIA
ncbi:photosystem II manganese-stabilizing polypeptide [Synechococcus sp. PCC 7335]|uniref:photosystem II manganese-stabilizing polypeptide n=1 Tax=Synechococcus sp. (strain ATCC 29403 / PCC 7335) TaxID=91464 RepID=UPI000570AF7F|nr:photosystem II manganese-stabilizing polypeptide [Synechococcus sp. PCC 7335]